MANDWEFVLALPNLRLPPTRDLGDNNRSPNTIDLGSDVVCLMGGEDHAVLEARRATPQLEQILGSFRDELGTAYVPAALFVRKSAPRRLRTSAPAFNDFRNAVAISMILPARCAAVRGSGSLSPIWSDTFDFHPAQINPNGRVILQSPALLNVVDDDPLHLTASPAIPVFSYALYADSYLYRCFGREWRRRYATPARDDRFSRSLFRSLEVAYHAASVGVKTFGSTTEFGTHIALWVSAIEILAWPARRHADLPSILDFLERAPSDRILKRRRFRLNVNKKRRSMNAIQRCYYLLYKARNQFLHGNPVSNRTLVGRTRGKRVGLLRLAALVYRYALISYLGGRYARAGMGTRGIGRWVLEEVDSNQCDEGLRTQLGLTL